MSNETAQGVVELVDGLIRQAIDARASDVHLEPEDDGLCVRFRVDGLLHEIQRLPPVLKPNVVARLKVMGGMLTYRSDIPQEGSIDRAKSSYPCDIRVASFPTVRGERVVLRLMAHAHQLLELEELGFDAALTSRLKQHLLVPQGLLVVCGPAGSGKTTTLYALLDYIQRQSSSTSIIAVEDPVEIRSSGITQIQVQPERGLTYPIVLRSLLRQDPQVLMIGEVRDAETAHIVVEAALTGHLLLTTIHSGSPAEAIVRLREMGVPAYQLTSTLRGVLAQRLLRTRSPAALAEQVGGGEYVGRTACGHFVELMPALRQAILDHADAATLSDPAICSGSLAEDAQRLGARRPNHRGGGPAGPGGVADR